VCALPAMSSEQLESICIISKHRVEVVGLFEWFESCESPRALYTGRAPHLWNSLRATMWSKFRDHVINVSCSICRVQRHKHLSGVQDVGLYVHDVLSHGDL
jgi:hypothetical protein